MAGYSVRSRLRDQKSKQKRSRGRLQEKQRYIRAVLTDEQGNTSGEGLVYFSEEERLVWYRELGASQPAKVKCDEIEPLLGLPVIIGIPEGGHEREVLRVDPTVKRLDPTAGPQKLINARQLEPGGAFMMWLYTKAIVPLATVPASGLAVSVVPGDYGYPGARKSYAGTASKSLASSQPAGPNEHRLVGLYLDANNALQTVNGTTVATSATPPEPTWPATAYRLSVVKLTDTASSFSINDIEDRRLFFGMQPLDIHNLPEETTADDADEVAIYNDSESAIYRMTRSNFLAGVSGWPFSKVHTVDPTDTDADYANLTDAIAAASAGDTILFSGTLSEAVTVDKQLTIVGLGPTSIIAVTSGSQAVNITAAGVRLVNFKITSSSTTNFSSALTWAVNDVVIENCTIEKTGATTNHRGLHQTGGTGGKVINCDVSASGATVNYGYRNDTATCAVEIIGGLLSGAFADISSNQNSSTVITLRRPKLANASLELTSTAIVRGQAVTDEGYLARLKPVGVPGGRLTLTTAVPVTTGDVTAAVTIYYTPLTGGSIEIFNGSFWVEYPFAELSLSLSGLTANTNYDVFIYDNSGTLTLEAVAWTNDTTRAIALTSQDGVYVKSEAATRRYLGTFRTTGTTGQCEDSATRRLVWNYYNRHLRRLFIIDATNHTYTSGTTRSWNNDATVRVDFVRGVSEDFIPVTLMFSVNFDAGDGGVTVGVGQDTTTASTISTIFNNEVADYRYLVSQNMFAPADGYHYWQIVEAGAATSPDFKVGIVMGEVWG